MQEQNQVSESAESEEQGTFRERYIKYKLSWTESTESDEQGTFIERFIKYNLSLPSFLPQNSRFSDSRLRRIVEEDDFAVAKSV